MQGNFFVFFFVPYNVNIPMYAGGFKQVQYKEYICWIQVKIHISDQTSLRICNSVVKCARIILSLATSGMILQNHRRLSVSLFSVKIAA